MLVRFKSTATESITMFGNVAIQLIEMLGASGAIPSAIAAKGLPAAAERLRQNLHLRTQGPIEPVAGDEADREQSVPLATRAAPLLDILKRASAANVPVMWEQA